MAIATNTRISRTLARLARIASIAVALGVIILINVGSDHNDGNGVFGGWDMNGRRDANITNFFAFRAPPEEGHNRLVLMLFLNAGITDPGYFFAEDLTVRFHIDNHSVVMFGDGDASSTVDDWMMRFGGTVEKVDKINHDVVLEVTFKPTDDGRTDPELRVEGIKQKAANEIRIFPGTGESPVDRSGSAVLVLEVPMELVVATQNREHPNLQTLVLWATTQIPEINGPISDHMGMPNTSNQALNLLVNRLRPRDQSDLIAVHPADLFVQPIPGLPVSLAPYADVLIYDLTRPAVPFPPGRGNPNLPPPPGYGQFNPFDPTHFPNGRPLLSTLANLPFLFPYFLPF
jgi:hypothetical protein